MFKNLFGKKNDVVMASQESVEPTNPEIKAGQLWREIQQTDNPFERFDAPLYKRILDVKGGYYEYCLFGGVFNLSEETAMRYQNNSEKISHFCYKLWELVEG